MKLRIWIWAGLLVSAVAPAAQPQNIERPGPVAHSPAGTSFPEQVGEFRRISAVQYDEAGENLSASYEIARGADRLRVSVYVYPSLPVNGGASIDAARAENCRTELDQTGQAIQNLPQYRGARRIDEGAAPPVEGVGRDLGLRSVYSFTSDFLGADQEILSATYLYCYVGGRWQVKYRASAPASFDGREAIEAFIRNGPWPGRNAAPDADKVVMIIDAGLPAS